MAYSITTDTAPTQLGGRNRIVVKKITPDAATGSITFSELTTVVSVIGFAWAGTLTANCYSADVQIDGSTANKVNFQLWKAGGTAADTAYLAFHVTVLGY